MVPFENWANEVGLASSEMRTLTDEMEMRRGEDERGQQESESIRRDGLTRRRRVAGEDGHRRVGERVRSADSSRVVEASTELKRARARGANERLGRGTRVGLEVLTLASMSSSKPLEGG